MQPTPLTRLVAAGEAHPVGTCWRGCGLRRRGAADAQVVRWTLATLAPTQLSLQPAALLALRGG